MGFAKGDKVEWHWGNGTDNGVVVEVEVFTDKVTRKIKGQEITRNDSRDEPA